MSAPRVRYHLNVRAALVLTALGLVAALGLYLLSGYQQDRILRSALAQVRGFRKTAEEETDPVKRARAYGLALRHVSQYVALRPTDPEGLEIQADMLANTGGDAASGARPIYERLLRILTDKNAPAEIKHKDSRAQAARIRLADLDIQFSQALLRNKTWSLVPERRFQELRFHAAEELMNQALNPAIEPPLKSAEAHRLRAIALAAQILPGKTMRAVKSKDPSNGSQIEIRDYAIQEFRAALEQDPNDLESAWGLYKLLSEEKHDPDAAGQVLKDFLKPGTSALSAEARMDRYDSFTKVAQREAAARDNEAAAVAREAASAELNEAARQAPEEVRIILAKAAEELNATRAQGAREWLDRFDKLPENQRKDAFKKQALSLKGTVEYSEQNPAKALEFWYEGLKLSKGTDGELTWRLASLEIERGNDKQADELVKQYRRLAGTDSPSLAWLEIQQAIRAGESDEESRDAHYHEAAQKLEKMLVTKKDQKGYELVTQKKESIQLALARCYEKLLDWDRAEKEYRKSLEANPRSLAPRMGLAELLAIRPIKASSGTKEAGEEGSGQGKGDEKKPEVEKTRDDMIEEGAVVLQEGLEYHPKNPTLLLALASARLRQQMYLPPERRNWSRFDLAYKRASAVVQQNQTLDLMQAERLAATEHPEQAIRFLREAVSKNPHSEGYARLLAEAFLKQGQADESLKVLEQAMAPKAAGDRGVLRGLRSKILAALGRGREARALLIRDLDKLPAGDRNEVWTALVLLLQSNGDPLVAYDAYLEWARQLPDYPQAKFMLLDSSIAAKDDPKVDNWLAELDPSKLTRAPSDQDNLFWLLAQARDQLYQRSKLQAKNAESGRAELEKAAQFVSQALNKSPRNLAAMLLNGIILEEEGRKEQADAVYDLARAGGSPEALLRLINLRTNPDFLKLDDPQRNEKLDRLWTNDPTSEIARFVAMACSRNHDPDGAKRIVEESQRRNKEVKPWQVEMFQLLGQDDEAEASLKKIAEQQSRNLEYWLSLIRYQASHERTGAANETIAKVVKMFQDNRPELVEAQCRTAAGDGLGADKAFDEALRRYPDDREVQLHAEKYFEGTGRLDRAESCLRHLLARDPKDRPSERQLAIVLSSRAGGVEKALALLGPDRGAGDAAEDRLVRGLVLARSTDATQQKQGAEILDALVGDLPADSSLAATARDLLVRILLASGQNDRARRIAATSAMTGSDPTAIALYAESLIRVGRFDEAEGQVDRLPKEGVAGSSEANLRARLIQGRASQDHVGPGQSAKALEQAYLARAGTPEGEAFGREIFPMLVALGPEAYDVSGRVARRLASQSAGLSWMPALVLSKQGNRDEAFALCHTAATNSTNDGDLREVGKVALELAVATRTDPPMLEKAEKVLVDTLKRAAEFDDLLVMRAMINHLQTRYREEVEIYRAVLKREPRHIVVLNNIAWALSEGLNQSTEALKQIDELIAFAGGRPEYLDTRGVILLRMGRVDDAVKVLETVVQAEPTGTHLFHLAQAYHKAGRDADCRKTFDLARKAGVSLEMIDSTERPSFEVLQNLPPRS